VVGQTYPGEIECIVVHDQEPVNPGLTRLGMAGAGSAWSPTPMHPDWPVPGTPASTWARGDFVATCDDDDIWHPSKLQTQILRLLDEPDLLAVGSGLRLRLPQRQGGRMARPGGADQLPAAAAQPGEGTALIYPGDAARRVPKAGQL
jgi:hypothetical protein